jgi:hypothetical protein
MKLWLEVIVRVPLEQDCDKLLSVLAKWRCGGYGDALRYGLQKLIDPIVTVAALG